MLREHHHCMFLSQSLSISFYTELSYLNMAETYTPQKKIERKKQTSNPPPPYPSRICIHYEFLFSLACWYNESPECCHYTNRMTLDDDL